MKLQGIEEMYAECRKHEDAAAALRSRIDEIEAAQNAEHDKREAARHRIEMEAALRKEWDETGELDGETLRNALGAGVMPLFLPEELAYSFATGRAMRVIDSPALANASEQAKQLWHEADEKRRVNDAETNRLRAANGDIERATRDRVSAIVSRLTPAEQQQFGANRIKRSELLRRYR